MSEKFVVEHTETELPPKEKKSNPVASLLKIIAALIFIGGFIAGIAMGSAEREFSLQIAATYWGAFLVSGSMFLGFAEIIALLQDIKDK